jgi:ATP-dependent DNA helicase DinG
MRMTKTTWSQIFQPVTQAKSGFSERTQQVIMGQAVIDAIASKENLIVEAPTGTGKSLAALVPIINYIKTAPAGARAVVSTATKSLQDQYMDDLAFLNKTYPKTFTYRSLKGRDNYLCWNAFKTNSRGNDKMLRIFKKLEGMRSSLKDGERGDIETALRMELTDYEWSYMSGSSKRCGENKCVADECFSKRARDLAYGANIVITNNAVIRVDADSRVDAMADTFLGEFDILVIDEAHELEASLVDGWTENFAEWEMADLASSVSTAIDLASAHKKTEGLGYETEMAMSALTDFLKSVVAFYENYHADQKWENITDALCLKNVNNGAHQRLIKAMEEYEEESAPRIDYALEILEKIDIYLTEVVKYMQEGGIKGIRKIGKGRTAGKTLTSVLSKIRQAIETKNGVFVDYGVPYSVLVQGIVRRSGEHTVKISVVPMDISTKAQNIWDNRTCILMSATMRDLSTGDFRLIKTCLGFTPGKELILDTVFDLASKQLTYVTPGSQGGYDDIVDVPGARFSMQELIDLIHAAKGRTLVLFTARRELDHAAEHILQLSARGEFDYPILVQTKEANKARLADQFKTIENSVLLATKSFFQGFNAPGETLSMTIVVKYPMPQYNVLCRNLIEWWRGRGFPNWYESKSMEVYQQAQGRLLRTETDYGIVALIDQRMTDPTNNVCKTAVKAVTASGSPVIRDIGYVKAFLNS